MNKTTPQVGSIWKHTNGNIYTVTGITNLYSEDMEKYPVTVIYQGANGNLWSRTADNWHTSMSFIGQEVEQTRLNRCQIIEADFTTDIVKIKMSGKYEVSAGDWYLCQQPPALGEQE